MLYTTAPAVAVFARVNMIESLHETVEADAPKWYQRWKNETELIRFEDKNLFFGGVHLVQRTPDGVLHGAGDPRRGGAVAHSDSVST